MSETTTPEAPAAEVTEAPEQQQTQGDPADKPLGENGEKALEAERRARKAAEKAARDLQAKVDAAEQANLSELEKAQRRAEKAEQELASLSENAMRQRVALEEGVPPSLVARLQGSTEEELREDARSLLELVRTPTTPKPDPSQGAKGDVTKGSADRFADFAETFFTR